MPEEQYSIYFDFSGGRNDTFSELKIGDNEGPDFHNVNLDRDGAVSRRRGAAKLHATGFGAGNEVGMLFQFRPSAGTAELLAAAGTLLAKYDGATPWVTLKSALTNNQVMLPAPFRNLLYLQNNADNPLVYYPAYAGSPKVWRAGTPMPASSPTFNANIAGSIATTGAILVRVRYVSPIDDGFVGEPDTDFGTSFTVTGSGGVRINIPVYGGSDHVVAKRVIERTIVGGSIFYIDGYVNDNVTTTYDITQSDAALLGGLLGPDPGTRGVMPKLWPFATYGNRIIGADPTDIGKVVYSEIDEFGILPEAFPEDNYIYLEVEDFSDAPVACAKLGEFMVFYCGKSIHFVHVDDGGNASRRRLGGYDVGIPSPRGIVELPNGHIVWTYRGPYFFNGSDFIPIGERIENYTASLLKSQVSGVYAVHKYDRRQVKFVLPISEAENTEAAVYHYRRATLAPEGFPVQHAWTTYGGIRAKSGAIGRDESTKQEVEWSGDYEGDVWVEDFGLADGHDAGGLVEARFQTKWFDGGNPFIGKDWLDAWFIITGEGAAALTCDWETEFGEGPSGSRVLDASTAAAVFDAAIFDTDVFASSATRFLHTQIAADGVGAVGKFIRFKISNTSNDEGFTVLGVILKWRPKMDRTDAAIA